MICISTYRKAELLRGLRRNPNHAVRWPRASILAAAFFGVLLVVKGMAVDQGPATADKPNVIFILADDLGYGSTNAYGANKSVVRTPHIDRLAVEGMRFTDASAPASVCSPSRYGFITGRYPFRSHSKYGVLFWWDNLLPNPNEETIADLFKHQGYTTAHIGKWHLGYGDKYPLDYTAKLTPGPNDLGFDYHLGVPHQHGDIMNVYIENDHVLGLRSRQLSPYSRSTYKETPYVGIDAPQREAKNEMKDLTKFATDWIRENKNQRFFLYFAPVAVHQPITPSDEMRGMSNGGSYGDFIQDLDASVGRLLETLDYLGLSENTLVVFTSDNGGEIPAAARGEDAPELQAIRAGLKINGDLRGDKHTIWEGGTREPFIIRWPGHVPAGTTCAAMISLTDMYATFWDMFSPGKEKPATTAPDSFSFFGCLREPTAQARRLRLVTQDANGMLALREGKWKYVDNSPPIPLEQYPENDVAFRNRAAATKPALFDLSVDPAEQHNLYDSETAVVRQMQAALRLIRDDPIAKAP